MVYTLDGKRILITREESQAKEFSRQVSQHGGIPVEVPLLNIFCKCNKDNIWMIQNLERYQWIFFTSANGVHCFFQLLNEYSMHPLLSKSKFAVVGRKTAHVLEKFGYRAEFIPTTYSAEAMTKEFFTMYSSMEEPVLLVQGNWSRNILPDWFQEQGICFQALEVYETSYHFTVSGQLNQLLSQNHIDVVTFTSPSSVDAFMEMKEVWCHHDLPIACIGTTTEQRASAYGLTNLIVPDEFTIEGMLARIGEYFERKG
ncbi:uroporphyrinogen-III synthase [Lentibacillus halodurans]|uniref:Uroporphyrinogen-III synthase n=1 Tax=Lentibacillus halodurans TaxID=237679 RepID=A0A1I0UXN9_9BACI|nr:uroporphyrinogen-III synthase [Lentibacillus halodurans]SFA68825.1 uroporphyrinogen-III synthase [Lentibacillus halodurans]